LVDGWKGEETGDKEGGQRGNRKKKRDRERMKVAALAGEGGGMKKKGNKGSIKWRRPEIEGKQGREKDNRKERQRTKRRQDSQNKMTEKTEIIHTR